MSGAVDCRGLDRPRHVLRLHAALRRLQPGESVTLLVDAGNARADIEAYLRISRNELSSVQRDGSHDVYTVVKGGYGH